MKSSLRILLLEDDPNDVELIEATIVQDGIHCEFIWVTNRSDYLQRLEQNTVDLILSDYSIPGFDGLSALKIARQKCPEIPFILVSGAVGEETTVEILKNGAIDFVLKNKLSKLTHSIRLAMSGVEERLERKKAEEALHKSEERFRIISQHTNDAVWDWEIETDKMWWSDGIEIVGYLPEEVVGQITWWVEKIHPDDQESVLSGLSGVIQAKGTLWFDEFRFQRADGEYAYVFDRGNVIYNEDGKPLRMIGSMMDISERKKTEQALREERALLAQRVEERTIELKQANQELTRIALMKDEFLANMSHELRTPLNAILGLSEALQEGVYGTVTARQKKSLGTIEQSGRHLLSLINDILDLSKIESGKMELELESVSVESVCQSSLQFIRQTALKKQLKIHLVFDNTVKTIYADERRLKQILVNLLSNAVKFTPDGGNVGLTVEGDAKQQLVHLTVWDSGIGVSQENIPKLFEPFIQLDSKLSRQYEGTGLGLALVHKMVEMHEGKITVESEVNQGSRFTVSLPWKPAMESSAAQGVEPQGQTDLTKNDLSRIQKALIIEDSSSVAAQVARYLSELKIDSGIVIQEKMALTEAINLQPDVIILDILFPEPTGWQILTQLKADPRTLQIPVLIVSVVEERKRGLELGASEYLVKPITRETLRRALEKIASQLQACETVVQPQTNQVLSTRISEPLLPNQPPLILLAEDNESNIEMLSDFLNSKEVRLIVARNGIEAVQLAYGEKPDIILMDIQMPDMDGVEAMRRIRNHESLAHIPIIALTALAMPGDREQFLTAGATAYLSKPVNLKEMYKLIEAQVSHYLESKENF